ncbi:hypothetical protein O3P69_002009 [Scylla paramamosain]
MQGDDQWRVESRDPDGIVRGRYVYKTPEGRLVDVTYDSGPQGYRAKGDAIPGGAAPLDQAPLEDLPVAENLAFQGQDQDQHQETHDTRDELLVPYGALLLTEVEKTQPSGDGIITFSDDSTLSHHHGYPAQRHSSETLGSVPFGILVGLFRPGCRSTTGE